MKPSPRRLKTIRHLRLGSDDHLHIDQVCSIATADLGKEAGESHQELSCLS